MRSLYILIKGQVQGVFYRKSAKDVAQRYGIVGWVKNTDDGDVEMLMQGSHEAVERLLEWCHHGPSGAVVRTIDMLHDRSIQEEEFGNFSIYL